MNLSMPQAATIPFRRAGGALGDMSSDVATMVIAAAGDIALVIDRDGIVRDLSITSHELAGNGWADWIDRPWIDTVTSESRHKVAEMLGDAGERTSPRWRELNHPGTAGASHPVRYMAVRPDDDGRVIVIGRDLQSSAALQQRLLLVQQSVERDYLKLRQAESRYRLLFQSTSEPVLILDEPTAGVDPSGSREIRDLIRELKERGKTVIFSSHLLEQVEDVADRVIILHRGQKLREGRLEDLLTQTGEWQVRAKGLGQAQCRELHAWLEQHGAEVLQEG
ncbi:MAG: hypothetical protein EBS42_15385, partial [Caulobacteraceae bacterium]|nr:hypothetical protein [Caulobacteraceae bacterium]